MDDPHRLASEKLGLRVAGNIDSSLDIGPVVVGDNVCEASNVLDL